MLYCQRIEHEDQRVPSDIPILFQYRDGPILTTLKWIDPYCYDTTTLKKTMRVMNDRDDVTTLCWY